MSTDADFDPETQRLDPTDVNRWLNQARSRRPRPASPQRPKFLAGPVPLCWLRQAAALPGSALAVGLAIWFLRGCLKRDTVPLGRTALEHLGVPRKPGYRGLKALEQASLVHVERRAGLNPLVTILRASEEGGVA